MGSFKGTLTGSLMGSKFNRKINENFDGKGGIWRREMKRKNDKGSRGGGNRNGEKGYKK